MKDQATTQTSLARVVRMILIFCGAALLSGCETSLDAENLRLCRMLLPVLHPSGTVIDIAATGSVEAPDKAELSGIRIDYLAKEGTLRHRAHYVLCYFDQVAFAQRRQTIRALITDRGPVSEAALVFVTSYLDDPDAIVEMPGPGTAELATLPHLPGWIAQLLQHALALLPMTGVYALLATSYALLYGLIGRINLAFGAIAAIGGVGGSLVLIALQGIAGGSGFAAGPFVIIGVALLSAMLLAACWGEGIAIGVLGPLLRREQADQVSGDRRTAAHTGQPILIATAGLLIALPEMLAILQPLRWLTPILNTPIIVARSDAFLVTVTPIALLVSGASLAMAGMVLLLMKYSAFGRSWRACADDALTASLFGVSPMRVLRRTVMLACALAGFAGFIFSVHYGNIAYSDGRILGLKALVAAIAGGIGSLPGAILGGILLGVLEAAWSANLPIESRDVAIFTALVVLLMLRPGGLFGFGDLSPRRV